MSATKKAAKPKRLTREPIIGRAARSGAWGAFSFELLSFTLDGEPLDPEQAAADVAGALVWIINNRRANGSS